MKKYNLYLIILTIFTISSKIYGQAGTGEKYYSDVPMQAISFINLNPVNNDSLIFTNPVCTGDSLGCNNEFIAFDREINFSSLNINSTYTQELGNIYTLIIESPNAYRMGVFLENLILLPGQKLFFFSPVDSFCLGAFTEYDNRINQMFQSSFLVGDKIGIQFQSGLLNPAPPNFNVKSIQHFYKNSGSFNDPELLDCHNNVNCGEFDAFCNESRSVTHLLLPTTFTFANCITTNTDVRWRICSGSILNNSQNNFDPLLFTAKHCVFDQIYHYWCFLSYGITTGLVDLNRTIAFFNYKSRECIVNIDLPGANRNMLNNSASFFMQGMNILAERGGWPGGSDLALLRFERNIPIQYNVFFNGWDRRGLHDLPTWDVTTIHHPKGTVMKITEGDLHWSLAYSHFWGKSLTNGMLQGGSSGSPLFENDNRRVIGAYSWYAGQEDCDILESNQQHRFGRLHNFWNNTKGFLSPDDEEREFLDGIDPIGSCQQNISLDGQFLPSRLYREAKPDITIQATNAITIAQNTFTTIRNPIRHNFQNFVSDYTLRSEGSIIIEPNNGFDAQTSGMSSFIMEIGDCTGFEGCGINYFNSPVNKNTLTEKNIQNEEIQDGIILFPNPTQGLFTISISDRLPNTQIKVSVVDMSGKVVYECSDVAGKNLNLDLSGMQAGTYLAKIQQGDKVSTRKIILNP